MTPGEESRIEGKLHRMELAFTKEIAKLAGKLDSALAVRTTVDDHEKRLRVLETGTRPSWMQLVTVLGAVAAVLGALWWLAGK